MDPMGDDLGQNYKVSLFALESFPNDSKDPILRFTTSFLQEIVAEGCRRPGPNVNDDAMRDAEQVFDDLRREELWSLSVVHFLWE